MEALHLTGHEHKIVCTSLYFIYVCLLVYDTPETPSIHHSLQESSYLHARIQRTASVVSTVQGRLRRRSAPLVASWAVCLEYTEREFAG